LAKQKSQSQENGGEILLKERGGKEKNLRMFEKIETAKNGLGAL